MSIKKVALSLLDLAPVFDGQVDYSRSVTLGQRAEAAGFIRLWYAEHHNFATIASLDPALMIAYVGSHTKTIGLAAGGVMLPNHVPFLIAEKFSMLAAMFPDRVLLGLGRAPGTDATTLSSALRRPLDASSHFVRDIKQLQEFLTPEPHVKVRAFPTTPPDLPLCILGSSLFGAQVAGELGLPFAFASHFAPRHLYSALETYRKKLPTSQSPNVKVAVNVVAAETKQIADDRFRQAQKAWLKATQPAWTERHINVLLESGNVPQLRYTAVGDGLQVREYLNTLARNTNCDELIIVPFGPNLDWQLETIDILADVMELRH